MNNQILVGTLATLNTFMAPLAGNEDPTKAVYKLVDPAPIHACAQRSDSYLGLHIDSDFGNYVTVQVGGSLCAATAHEPTASGGPANGATANGRAAQSAGEGNRAAVRMQNVEFAVLLPADLLDEEFLRRLPTNAAYVIANVPIAKGSPTKTRIKITKHSPEADSIPLGIEWLPDDRGHIEHPPMMLWLKSSFAGNVGLPWEKVSFSELPEVKRPLVFAGEVPSEKQRPTKLR